jgi:hypothetical protein
MNSGVLIALVAILLAIPLSVLANLLTPKVQRWWGTTSRSRKIKRMENLKNELERIASLRITERLLLIAASILTNLAVVLIGLLATLQFPMPGGILQNIAERSLPLDLKISSLIIRLAVIFGTVVLTINAGRLRRLRDMSSPSYEQGLRDELMKLRSEFPSSTESTK